MGENIYASLFFHLLSLSLSICKIVEYANANALLTRVTRKRHSECIFHSVKWITWLRRVKKRRHTRQDSMTDRSVPFQMNLSSSTSYLLILGYTRTYESLLFLIFHQKSASSTLKMKRKKKANLSPSLFLLLARSLFFAPVRLVCVCMWMTMKMPVRLFVWASVLSLASVHNKRRRARRKREKKRVNESSENSDARQGETSTVMNAFSFIRPSLGEQKQATRLRFISTPFTLLQCWRDKHLSLLSSCLTLFFFFSSGSIDTFATARGLASFKCTILWPFTTFHIHSLSLFFSVYCDCQYFPSLSRLIVQSVLSKEEKNTQKELTS